MVKTLEEYAKHIENMSEEKYERESIEKIAKLVDVKTLEEIFDCEQSTYKRYVCMDEFNQWLSTGFSKEEAFALAIAMPQYEPGSRLYIFDCLHEWEIDTEDVEGLIKKIPLDKIRMEF